MRGMKLSPALLLLCVALVSFQVAEAAPFRPRSVKSVSSDKPAAKPKKTEKMGQEKADLPALVKEGDVLTAPAPLVLFSFEKDAEVFVSLKEKAGEDAEVWVETKIEKKLACRVDEGEKLIVKRISKNVAKRPVPVNSGSLFVNASTSQLNETLWKAYDQQCVYNELHAFFAVETLQGESGYVSRTLLGIDPPPAPEKKAKKKH